MISTVVLKFGGSSVADNIKLNVVAEKIISMKKEAKNIVVVVSAQGKTTDKLLKEAQELSAIPDERELDVLISTGEQITIAKLSILLNRMGYKAVSLTGWQDGIRTSDVHKSAKIEEIYTNKITKELEKGKIVIVAGFQGIDKNGEITTLGRGGSDTTAVAIQAAIGADKCYIFSDVDGIYSSDPNMITVAKRLDEISFDEMQEVADAGAKVLHNRCIQLGKKFDLNITAKSTFTDEGGTVVRKKIEDSEVKSIVKNDNLMKIKIIGELKKTDTVKIYKKLLQKNIIVEDFEHNECKEIEFRILRSEQNKVQELLETEYPNLDISQSSITKLAIVGYGITQDNKILKKIIKVLENDNVEITDISLNQSKIEILSDEIKNETVEKLHKELI